MKKLTLIILLALVLLPVSVYAYSNNASTNDTITDADINIYDMMNSRHEQHIEYLKQSIIEKLNNGEITQEEADKELAFINQMDQYHNNQDGNTFRGCH